MSLIVLGVRVDDYSHAEALEKAKSFLSSDKPRFIFTPNPEMLVKAQTDLEFRNALNAGSLNICDGSGLAFAARRAGRRIERITGVDFMLELCAEAEKGGKSIYLLGTGDQKVVKTAAENLLKQLPGLKIAGYNPGIKISENKTGKLEYSKEENDKLLEEINAAKPDIIFVAFGMGKQEKWLLDNASRLSFKVGMGIGGSFEYIAGTLKRAPLLMRKLGLEWVYRLMQQPRRLPRIFNATVRFTFSFLTAK